MGAKFEFRQENLLIFGSWDKNSTAELRLEDFINHDLKQNLILDFKGLEFIDTIGVRFFLALEHDLSLKNVQVKRINLSPKAQALFELCEKNYKRSSKIKKPKKHFADYFVKLGRLTFTLFAILKKFINFTGAFFVSFIFCLKKPKNFRFISFLYHIETSSLKALPIITLTSLLVGVVLAYQAAYQLSQFGANIFIVDLVGISATRELAPLISAIVIAGRSASSYTAQIGVMKITDEIAAMNTMGFRSFEFIILPRVLALVIAMPLIVAVSDFISIFGGMVVARVNLDISFGEFLKRFSEAVALKHILIGLFKAPMFGFLIGIIACFRGFEVKNTTSSIGVYTTKSVVNAIFWVIAFDAIFSIVLTQMDI
ncbi:MAG: ABC transporter permease [Campylobacter sp.]|nr:ABC transporter permease [Campylobacter sp.]